MTTILRSAPTVDFGSILALIHSQRGLFYAEYSKEKAVDMLVLLRHIADYVIVDCTSVLTGNVLATAALEVADDVLRVCGCDLKAISYFASYLPLIEDRKFKPEQHIRALSNTRPYITSSASSGTQIFASSKRQISPSWKISTA